jgi:hypothetical protein
MTSEHLSGLRHIERAKLESFGPFGRLADPTARAFGTSWHVPGDGKAAFVEVHYLNVSKPGHYISVATQKIPEDFPVDEPDSFLKFVAQHRANEAFRSPQLSLSFAAVRDLGKDWARYSDQIRKTHVELEAMAHPASEIEFSDAVFGFLQEPGLSIYWSGTGGEHVPRFALTEPDRFL